jgi:hypothetical protein
MAGITSGGAAERSGGRSTSARWPWRPQGRRNGVLTSVATGRSAGVSEGVCDAVTRTASALVGEADRRRDEGEAEEAGVAGLLGSRGSGSSSGAAPASRRVVLLRAPPFSSFSPPSPSPPACGYVGRGLNPPRLLGLGEPWGRGGGFL